MPRRQQHETQAATTADENGSSNFLFCTLFNARSVFNKLPDLHNLLYTHKYDCIFVTESWLKPDIPNGMLDPEHHYNVFRTDRSVHRGGGVCVFVVNKLHCQEVTTLNSERFDDDSVDLLMFDIVIRPQKYRFVLVYRRPEGGTTGGDAAEKLCDIMSRHQNRNGPTIILGDLNCPGIDWTYGCPPMNIVEQCIYNFCQSNGFIQCVPEATRGPNKLDVVCINEPLLLSAVSVQPPFVNSDHDSVDFQLLMEGDMDDDVTAARASNGGGTTRRCLWSQGDYQAMVEYLSDVDWSSLFTTNFTPDDIWTAFCGHLDEAINQFVPTSDVQSQRRRVNVRHYPRHIRRLMARKLTVWRAHKTNPSDPKLKERYKQLTADCRNAVRKHEIYKERKVIDSNNLGAFYNHVNKRLTSRSSIGTLLAPNGAAAETDVDKAEL